MHSTSLYKAHWNTWGLPHFLHKRSMLGAGVCVLGLDSLLGALNLRVMQGAQSWDVRKCGNWVELSVKTLILISILEPTLPS